MADETTQQAQTATPEASAASAIDDHIATLTGEAATSTDQSQGQEPQSTTEQADGTEAAGADSTPDATDKPTLTEAQRQAAKHLGYADDEIAQLTPTEAKRIERESASRRKLESRIGRLQQQLEAMLAGKPTEQAAATEGQQADAQATLDGLEEIGPDDDIEDFTRKTNSNLRKLLELTQRQQQELAALRTEAQAPIVKQTEQQVDAFFAKLDTEVYDQFGTGKLSELDADSPEATERRRLVRTAKRLLDMHTEDGDEATLEQCLDEALAVVAKEQFTKAATKGVREAQAARKAGAVARPSGSHRQEAAISPEDRAAHEIEMEARKRNIAI